MFKRKQKQKKIDTSQRSDSNVKTSQITSSSNFHSNPNNKNNLVGGSEHHYYHEFREQHRSINEVYLPPDFIQFIQTNYEKISEIEERIRKFHQQNLALRFKKGENKDSRGRFLWRSSKTISTETSASSDHDVVNIISATVIPKSGLSDEFDAIRIDSSYLEKLKQQNPSFDEKELEGLRELVHKFPLVFLSDSANNSSSHTKIPLIVEGSSVQFSERHWGFNNNFNNSSKRKLKKNGATISANASAKYKKRKNSQFYPKLGKGDVDRRGGSSGAGKLKNGQIESIGINELALDIYNRYFAPSNKQLTLPPLHSSVLTLLGQRGPSSSISPRNGLIYAPIGSASKNKGQKLRRHNRKLKKNSQNEETVEKMGQTEPLMLAHANSMDDTLENKSQLIHTQISNTNMNDATSFVDHQQRQKVDKLENRKSLQQVLDEYLAKNSWHMQDSKQIEKEIEELKSNLRKNETHLTTGNIGLREDVWLSFPKTSSKSSCTFQAPKSYLELKTLTPLEYLRKYVITSQPRQHLYNLVFERYRLMENPVGKHITAKIALKALTEVLGQVLTQEEARELFENYLNIESEDYELDQETFGGICAVSERIYSKYAIEDCTKNSQFGDSIGRVKHDRDGHLNQHNQLETADLEYLLSKVLDKQVNLHLSELLNAICKRNI